MRISDWSSDVCSSDLLVLRPLVPQHQWGFIMRGESRLYIGGINGTILAWRQGAKGLADKSNRLFGPDVPIYLHFNGTAFQERFPGCTEGLGRQCSDFRAVGRAPAHITSAQQLPHIARHHAFGRA